MVSVTLIKLMPYTRKGSFTENCSLRENAVQMRENTDQKKLLIWTLFTQCDVGSNNPLHLCLLSAAVWSRVTFVNSYWNGLTWILSVALIFLYNFCMTWNIWTAKYFLTYFRGTLTQKCELLIVFIWKLVHNKTEQWKSNYFARRC